MEELFEILSTTQGLFDELLAVEARKLEAVTENDVPVLDECIKQEEALALQLRGLDKKREDLQKAMGHEGLTLLQTADKVGGADGESLKEFQAALSAKAKELNETMEGARKVIDLNLQAVEAILDERAAADAGYQPTGEKNSEEPEKPRFTPKEV